MTKLVALTLLLAMTSTVTAGPRSVLVLPLDGSAPPATRDKLSASLQKMARVLDGDVQAGNATFADTAAAVGCDPNTTACVERVRATLGVDALVYGTAEDHGDTVQIVARRYQTGDPQPREVIVTVGTNDPPQTIEPELLPVFGNDPIADPQPPIVEPIDREMPVDRGPPESKRDRNIAIGITVGGAGFLLLGLSLWSQKSDLQGDIDSFQVNSANDITRLKALEDKASSRAWAGNLFVAAGLGVASYGIYRLYKYRHRSVVVTPTPVEGGAAVMISIPGGL